MSSRLFVFLVPLVVIAIFWFMARAEKGKHHDPTHKGFFERNGTALGIVFIALVAFWTLFLVTLPYLYMVVESFHPKLPPAQRGGPTDVLTIAQYKSFFINPVDNEINTTHIWAFVFSIITSVLVTAVNFAICYPLAYYMAQAGTAQKVRLIMLALIVPYWVNEILRAFSLRLLLASKGLINQALMGLGITSTPIDFLSINVGLYVGLSYAYLLVMIFPLYNAIESLDKNQIEAARDLGAPWWKIHRDVVIPYAKPGIASGCTMVFMLAAGSLAAPQFLGGPSTLWFTSIVYDFFFQAFNWPRGAAYAFILLTACIAFVLLMLRMFKVSLGETIK
ncbi:ABC transporter permease [Aestuariivirga litoralis]|uniref:ABC transporter permease n=1 Tax=Aestuariivirga litoralis TaxID=2650924 RepID=A0A2W2ATC7_9HYPH|nr:ABC transporter permease [Aestuariivirga litoralis]PZF78461.1 ABC transporter permease [Aestuariivirga litoralis]